MKQHTTNEQTTKLIELGVEPKQVPATSGRADDENYFIGELIEMLPKTIENSLLDNNLNIYTIFDGYQVEYSNILGETYFSFNVELIDALYEMVIKLKKENVI